MCKTANTCDLKHTDLKITAMSTRNNHDLVRKLFYINHCKTIKRKRLSKIYSVH